MPPGHINPGEQEQGGGMEEERNLSMYFFILVVFLCIVLYMANLMPLDENRVVISMRIIVFSATVIMGVFTVLSYFGKWG
jgi:hypothetical protein